MIDTLRRLGQGLSRGLGSLAEGWRELRERSGGAITRFLPGRSDGDDDAHGNFPAWAVLAGEIADTGKALVIRMELPGVDRDDCEVVLTRDLLQVYGEKRSDRELVGADYYVRERAYGRFRRTIALPLPVDADRAHANFRNGVLTVKAPKLESRRRHRLAVQ